MSLQVQTGYQIPEETQRVARYFPNFEAASRRLTRWLHNARLAPQVQA